MTTYPAFQPTFGGFQHSFFAYQSPIIENNIPIGGNGSPTDWWGLPSDEQIFPLLPTVGFVPGVPIVVDLGEPELWAYDNNFVGYTGFATFREASVFENPQGDEWWGPLDPLEQIFPLLPTVGFVPPTPVVDNAPPINALWVYDNGFVGYVRSA